MGRSISEVFSYDSLWADLVIGPYEKFASEHIWVAEEADSGEILGYLTASLDPDFYAQQTRYLEETVERLQHQSWSDLVSHPLRLWGNALSLLAGLDRRTLEFLHYLRSEAKNEIPQRPATPHFNVFTRIDGCGVAHQLIAAFIAELRRRRAKSYHITALFIPEKRERETLTAKGFRVRPLEFFTTSYQLYDALETRIFLPHKVMIGVFERNL